MLEGANFADHCLPVFRLRLRGRLSTGTSTPLARDSLTAFGMHRGSMMAPLSARPSSHSATASLTRRGVTQTSRCLRPRLLERRCQVVGSFSSPRWSVIQGPSTATRCHKPVRCFKGPVALAAVCNCALQLTPRLQIYRPRMARFQHPSFVSSALRASAYLSAPVPQSRGLSHRLRGPLPQPLTELCSLRAAASSSRLEVVNQGTPQAGLCSPKPRMLVLQSRSERAATNSSCKSHSMGAVSMPTFQRNDVRV